MEFDPYETCPFDKAHRIRRSRMQCHLTLCGQHFHGTKLMQCPFDARHKINQVEFEHHKKHCPARISVIDYALHDPVVQAETRILPINVAPVGESEENWDEDCNVKTYNPIKAIRDKPIVYSVIGLSKAKRKEHRIQERQRFENIMETNGLQTLNQSDIQSDASFLEPQSAKNKEEEEYKPLRRPFKPANKTATPQQKNQKTAQTQNDSIIDKLSKTFEEIGVNDKGHKKKTEQLDKEIKMLKKTSLRKEN